MITYEPSMPNVPRASTQRLGPIQQLFAAGPQPALKTRMSIAEAQARGFIPNAPRASAQPLGPMQQRFAAGPQPLQKPRMSVAEAQSRGLIPNPPRASAQPLGPMQQRFAAGPVAPPLAAGAAMLPPIAAGAALLGLGAAGWEYGAPRAEAQQYTYDEMGNITGLAGYTPPDSLPPTPMSAPQATQPGYTGDVGMMARHAMPAPMYPPDVAAHIAQRRAIMEQSAITDRLNRESTIRESVMPMPMVNPMYNPQDYADY